MLMVLVLSNPMRSAVGLRYQLATAVRVDLPVPSRVAAAVFGIGGRRVRTIVEGSLPAGTHSSAWDRHDASGRTVPAGVYLVRVRAGGREFERKAVVR